MTAAAKVSTEDIAGVRHRATALLDMAGPDNDYVRERIAAVRATLDWVEGVTETSPVGGFPLEPTAIHLHLESARAVDAEDKLQRRGERGTHPGTVGETLAYVLGRAAPPV